MPEPAVAPLAVLVVCTANICRSPMAEVLLRHRATEASFAVDVSSAGFLFDGESPTDATVTAMAEVGLDVSGHRSRIVGPEMVRAADLVVTMERTHARNLAVDVLDASGRIHTLGAAVAGLRAWSDGTVRERIARIGAQRDPGDLLGSGDDEVDDPHGRSVRVHRRTAARLDDMVTELVERLSSA